MSAATGLELPRFYFRDVHINRMFQEGLLPKPFRGKLFEGPLTVEQYEQLIERGVLNENDRCELIHGEVVEKMALGNLHMAAVKRLNGIFSLAFAGRATIGIQDAVRIPPASEPEPDISVLAYRKDNYITIAPGPQDIYLLIEVADSSLETDQKVKGPMYAEAGIREYWILDVLTNQVTIYRDPKPDGTWATILNPAAGETVEVQALPGVKIAVAELLT